MMEIKTSEKATIKMIREIGRVKKMRKDPLERINDPRRDCSIRGPKTKVIIKGAPSYLNFLIR
jgi:hypothetical protein